MKFDIDKQESYNTIERVYLAVAEVFGLKDPLNIEKPSLKKKYVIPRLITVYLLKTMYRIPDHILAARFGWERRNSVYLTCRRIKRTLHERPLLQEKIEQTREILLQQS